jgi:pimeloyl-ACP methyl ester carboxylesterase
VQGPFRLRPGPSGDLATYASATSPGAPVRGHVVLCHDLPRPRGSAADVGLTFPALADRLTRESGWRVVTATLRGAGESDGDFSPMGWLEDLAFVADEEIPESSPRLVVGFGFGGVLALHLAAGDERIAGVACLGTPADLASLVPDPVDLLNHCRRTGVITTDGFPASVEAWSKELSYLHPAEDAALLKGRPLLLAHGANDPDVPVAEARALADAATGPSELHLVLGAGHWLRADPRAIAVLVGWLERRH